RAPFLSAEPLGSPAWILLLCWGLAACYTGGLWLCLGARGTLAAPLTFTPPLAAGESVTVSCEALSELPEMTLLYWLENGFFVEIRGRGSDSGAAQAGTRPLGLSFNKQHLHTNFTCVVLSPLGADTREVQWPSQAPPPVPGKSGGLG
uniref:Uncharacterized protein n=1 Tax=Geospiza parvula TaxID=87175 RepID=A0A8C3M9I9_GEOPR